MKKELLLATSNKGKIKEIKHIFKDTPFKTVTIWDVDSIPNDIEVKETGETFEENAKLKAETLGKLSNLLTLADDSGLEIDALNGKPGVRSARFTKGSDTDKINKVLQLLHGVPDDKRNARFITVIAIYDPNSSQTTLFRGTVEGKITTQPKGNRGFGYDPIFFSTELGKTFAEASAEEKNEVSHRARALFKATEYLIKRFKDKKV